MKTKVFLPVMAIMLAIGMSFATEKVEMDPTQDYYQESSGVFMSLGTEIDCGDGFQTCEVRLPNGEIHTVYDAPDPNSAKIGDGQIKNL